MLADPILRGHQHRVPDQHGDDHDAHRTKPASQRDQVDQVGQGVAGMCLLRPRLGGNLKAVPDLGVDGRGDHVALPRVAEPDFEERCVVLVLMLAQEK